MESCSNFQARENRENAAGSLMRFLREKRKMIFSIFLGRKEENVVE